MKRIALLPIVLVLAAVRPSGGPARAAETVAKVPQGSEETIRSLIGEYIVACKQIENERGMHPSHRRGHTRRIRAEVRLQAALRHMPNVAGILIPMLDHANVGIRRIAAKALTEIGPDERASAPMIATLLDGKHAPVAIKALARLGLGATAVVPALEKALQAKPTSELRDGICNVLAGMGSSGVEVLTKAIGSEDPGMRATAAQGLGKIGPSAAHAVGALAGLLNDKQAAVRREAADALGRMGPAAGDAATALTGTLKDADPGARLPAARALRRIDRTTGQKTIGVLVALLKDAKPEIRQDAACALAAHGAGAIGAVPALVGMLKDSPRASVKAAATALVLIGPKGADVAAALREALKHPRVEARVVAAEVLHYFEPGSTDVTVPVLLAALKTQYGSFEKLRAVRAFGKIGTPAVAGLMTMFDKTNTNNHRWMAAMALAEIGKDAAPATDMLIGALDEPKRGDYHHHVRSWAARALGRIGARKDISVPILTRMLQDRYVRRGAAEALHLLDPDVNRRHMGLFVKALDRGDGWSRRDAADALGRIGPAAKDAIGALLRLEYDTDGSVRAAALEAVRRMRGDALGPLSLTAEATLPGSWLSLAGAMRDGYDFIAVCQAPGQADVMNETGRLGMAAQSLIVCKALAARAQVVSEIDVAYLYPRYSPRRWVEDGELVHSGAVPKGRRLIWIIRQIPAAGPLTRKRRNPAYLGVKALPDTPENRAAVARAVNTVNSAKLLRANVRSFRMTLAYRGPKPRDFIRLTLTAAPMLPKPPANLPPWEQHVHIDEKQAAKIIDHLVESGFFARARCVSPYRRTILKAIRGPAYVLTVTGGAGWLFRGDLGWGMKMLPHLDALRKVLDGNTARSMDTLLDKLAPQRKKWQQDARVRLALARHLTSGDGTNRADGSSLVKLPVMVGVNAAVAGKRDVKRRAACLVALREIRKGFPAIVRKYPKGLGHLGPGELDEDKLFLRFGAKTLPKATPAMRPAAGRSRPRLLQPKDCGLSFRFTTPMSPKANAGQWLHVNVGLVWWWMWPNRGLSTETHKAVGALVRRAVAGLDALEDAAVAAGAASRGKGPYVLRGRPGVELTIRLSPKRSTFGTVVDLYATNQTKQRVALCPPFLQIIRDGKPWHHHAHSSLPLGVVAVLSGREDPFTTIEPGRSAKIKSRVVSLSPGKHTVRIAAGYLRDYWVDVRPTFHDGAPVTRKVNTAWTGALVSNELTVHAPAPTSQPAVK